jgi:hypothetical protein
MGQPPSSTIVDAEIVEDLPSLDDALGGSTSVDEAAAEMVSVLTEVAFREARTDEWIVAEPGLPDPPLRALRQTPMLEPVQPDLRVLDADSWDTAPRPLVEQHYQGRRRRRAPPFRLWLVIGLVVTALTTAIAVPWLLTSGDAAPAVARTPAGVIPPPVDEEDISGTSAPGAAASSTPGALPGVGASPLVTPSPSEAASATPSDHTTAPSFNLTIQAERGGSATAWGGSAATSSFAGATVVDRLGSDWGTNDGWLEFRGITVPSAGLYKVKIWHVYTNLSPNTGTRRMSVIVNGSTTSTQTFSTTPTITARDLTVTLKSGTNVIRLTHNTTRSPAVDRIEITQA